MSCYEHKYPNRKNSIPTLRTYMNNGLFEIENTRVPILLIGLSERSLLEGNRKLITLRATNFTDHKEYWWKRNKRKREEPEAGNEQQITHEVPPNNSAFLSNVGSFVSVKDLTVKI